MLALAFAIGIVAGIRTFMAPAAIAWAAWTGALDLEGTWLAFLGWRFMPGILSFFALGELYFDKKPSTLSRKVPAQFGARLVSGGVGGAAIGYGLGAPFLGLLLGIIGAVIGTLAGAAARARSAARFGGDRPGALVEDVIAIAGAVFVVAVL